MCESNIIELAFAHWSEVQRCIFGLVPGQDDYLELQVLSGAQAGAHRRHNYSQRAIVSIRRHCISRQAFA